MKYLYYYETNIGKIGIAEEKGLVTNLYFMNSKQPLNAKIYETDLLKETFIQIKEYLLRERKEFDIPINPSGKTLEQQIYIEILNIPYGERISYKELIDKSGITTTTRMISSVVHKNPIPIIIPCHRLRRNDNKPISYVGGNDIFEKLTSIEAPHP